MLNDVWRNISSEIGIFWKGRFDRVPPHPGVYAWFYPLRVTTRDLGDFLTEVSQIFAFDAAARGTPAAEVEAAFTWRSIGLHVRVLHKDGPVPKNVSAQWEQIVSNDARFDQLRRMVLRGSILMPPLYVGKTHNLLTRCGQHLAGSSDNSFHARYVEYARSVGAHAQNVSDLIFACIRTGSSEVDDDNEEMETVVEEILKRASRPPYGIK
ncbi:MAG: hypothetical protein HS104_26975 [Polyangiaceae bacterium]|nr:hypothetical protein [Polyangiaceae bacterium]